MFSSQGLIEMLKAIAKAVLVGGVAVWVLWHNSGAVLALATEPLGAGMAHMVQLLGTSLLIMAGSHRRDRRAVPALGLDKQLRMTKEEVRQEAKEQEGDPQIKARIRASSARWRAAA